jgi:hypothetical protein
MNTQENNKLIAEFMGYKISYGGEYLLSDSLPQFLGSDHREWCSNRVENDNLIWEIPKDCLEYHTSWDWLKPVVDKIEQVHEGVPQELINLSLFSTIDEVYNAVVEFIKQYNNNSFKTSSELAQNC